MKTTLPLYPGFTDDAVEEMVDVNYDEDPFTEREDIQRKQLAEDAGEAHDAKHQARSHPWCRRCVRRDMAAHYPHESVFDDTVDYSAMPDDTAMNHELDQAVRYAIQDPSVAVPASTIDALAERFGIDRPVMVDIVEWERTAKQDERLNNWADGIVRDRLKRWILLRRPVPTDTYDPDAEQAYDDLYVDATVVQADASAGQLIAGVLDRQTYTLLVGRKSSFKTFLGLDWALSVATGYPWLGHAVEQAPVLYIMGEGVSGLDARVKAWEYAHQVQVLEGALTVRRQAFGMDTPTAALDELIARVQDRRYGLVVIDTLRRVSGRADGNGPGMGAVIDAIERIKVATGEGSVLVLAHSQAADNDARGFTGIEDDADRIWHARRPKPYEPDFTIELRKAKDAPDGLTLQLTTVTAAQSLYVDEGNAADHPAIHLTPTARKVLDALDAEPDGMEAEALLAVSGVSRASFYRAVAVLKESQIITETGGWYETLSARTTKTSLNG